MIFFTEILQSFGFDVADLVEFGWNTDDVIAVATRISDFMEKDLIRGDDLVLISVVEAIKGKNVGKMLEALAALHSKISWLYSNERESIFPTISRLDQSFKSKIDQIAAGAPAENLLVRRVMEVGSFGCAKTGFEVPGILQSFISGYNHQDSVYGGSVQTSRAGRSRYGRGVHYDGAYGGADSGQDDCGDGL